MLFFHLPDAALYAQERFRKSKLLPTERIKFGKCKIPADLRSTLATG